MYMYMSPCDVSVYQGCVHTRTPVCVCVRIHPVLEKRHLPPLRPFLLLILIVVFLSLRLPSSLSCRMSAYHPFLYSTLTHFCGACVSASYILCMYESMYVPMHVCMHVCVGIYVLQVRTRVHLQRCTKV